MHFSWIDKCQKCNKHAATCCLGNCFTLWTVYSHILCSHDIRSLLLLNTIQVIESIANIHLDILSTTSQNTFLFFLNIASYASFAIKGYMCSTNITDAKLLIRLAYPSSLSPALSLSLPLASLSRNGTRDISRLKRAIENWKAVDQTYSRNDKVIQCLNLIWILVFVYQWWIWSDMNSIPESCLPLCVILFAFATFQQANYREFSLSVHLGFTLDDAFFFSLCRRALRFSQVKRFEICSTMWIVISAILVSRYGAVCS